MVDMNYENEETTSRIPQDSDPTITQEVVTADFERSATLVGQILDGRFLIENDLTESGADKGGIGLVYLARDTKMMDRKVVVKILQKAALENAEVIRKFQHEKEALIRLNHPNIVSILDSGTLKDGNPFMVMEYIPGHSLRKLLRESGTVPFDLAAHIIESVGNALGAAHAQKILHRDLKPENIMLTPHEGGFDQVKLIDFGIARVEESQLAPETVVGMSAGTLKYMAPEQIVGQLLQTPAIDIFAFSTVIYEMLTGAMPFPIKSKTMTEAVVELYEQQKAGVRIKPSELRPDLATDAERILLSGLEHAPESRPQDSRVYGRQLAAALRSITVAANDVGKADATLPSDDLSQPTVEKPRPAEPSFFTAPPQIPVPKAQQRKSKSVFLTLAIVALVLTALAIPAGIIYMNSGETGQSSGGTATGGNTNVKTSAGTAATSRELKYFLNVQKMRDGKSFEEPFKSSGQEIFESGYKFSMVLVPDADGYLYIYNEGKDAAGKTQYYLLFPTPKVNGGSSSVKGGKQFETGQNTFGGSRGTEVMWGIWTKERNADLEAVRQSAFSAVKGQVDSANSVTLRAFIDKNYDSTKEQPKADPDKMETIVKTSGDVIVHKANLQHR